VNKLLIGRHRKFSFFGALFGLFIGIFILLIVFQIYLDINKTFIQDESLISEDYLVINKKLSVLNSLNIIEKGFSQEEINDIKNQKFVSDIGSFIANEFSVSAYTKSKKDIPAFYTDLFFEGVEARFLDIDTNDWKWDESKKIVPIIIPRDYLKLYNFGFAQSQNLPQITEGVISRVGFKIKINSDNNSEDLIGKIYGFSDRINSILVPYDFIIWGNKNFSKTNKPNNPSRLIIKSDQKHAEKLISYLNKNQYESSDSELKTSKLQFLLKTGVFAISIISLIIIFLAFLSFILSFNIIVLKSEKSIKTLINLGYSFRFIINFYNLVYIVALVFSTVLSVSFVAIVKFKYVNYFEEYGFKINAALNHEVLITAFLIMIILAVFNFFNLKTGIKKTNNSLI